LTLHCPPTACATICAVADGERTRSGMWSAAWRERMASRRRSDGVGMLVVGTASASEDEEVEEEEDEEEDEEEEEEEVELEEEDEMDEEEEDEEEEERWWSCERHAATMLSRGSAPLRISAHTRSNSSQSECAMCSH
jgi:hypothetical protein